MATVSIQDVRKRYGRVDILHGVGFDIADGEFVVLVGPSGCGKSTLLRMIAGLESISDGQIRIGDRVVNDLPVKERDIAMVFQSYALYPHLSVEKNMGFSLRLAKRPGSEIYQRVMKAAEILDLKHLLGRYPRELSGGQRQRVAMGRAMVRDPQVFLFDEPLSNLDAKLRVQMRAEIKELHQRLKSTIVYVTHDQIEAMTMADRIVVMNGGRVEQIGAPLALYDRPANTFVATFIGTPAMNLIEGRADGGRFIVGDGIWLPMPVDARAGDGRQLLYGVRPESFEMDTEGAPVQVVVVEPTGPETHVLGTLGGQKISMNLHQRLSAKPGETLRVRPMLKDCHLFDRASGRRIDAAAAMAPTPGV